MFLGNIPYALTHITTTGNVIFTVYLTTELPAEVFLRFYYREELENPALPQTHNVTTPTPYSGLKTLTYLEPNAPFEQFKVDISLVYESLESPMYQGLSQSIQGNYLSLKSVNVEFADESHQIDYDNTNLVRGR